MNSKSQPDICEHSADFMSNVEAGVNMANVLRRYSYHDKTPITGISMELNQGEFNFNNAIFLDFL